MMNTTNRRIALLTGASAAALGLSALAATPALAAPHDGLPPGTYAGTDTTGAAVTICTLATNPECFFGVIDTGVAVATAVVNSTATGRIYHHDNGGLVDITLINAAGDSAEIGAIATATTAANASVSDAILQTGTGTDVTLNITNDGALLIDAIAIASNPAGGAFADASVRTGISQSAFATATASANFVNNGTLTVLASAVASGTGAATASASAFGGISQHVNAPLAIANATNNGVISIIANASANGSSADASVNWAGTGMYQDLDAAGGTASGLMVNSGTVAISANAVANATAGSATATASAGWGMVQTANVGAGTANLEMVNNGAVSIAASASANGETAYASAWAESGMVQDLQAAGAGGIANGVMTNSGTVALSANAVANATTASASAEAGVWGGMWQEAQLNGGGVADLALTNNGALSLVANASANGVTAADASAWASGAIYQSAWGTGGAANMSIVNAGTVTVSAHAVAVAGDDATVDTAEADASATGISQWAGNLATNTMAIVNSGTLNVAADATATAQENASASATALGVQQRAFAVANDVSFTNSGAINVHAGAVANAPNAVAGTFVTANASAIGYDFDGGVGTLVAVNSGTLAVDAVAVAPDGSAFATAIGMNITLATGTVSVTNAGTISVLASASGAGGLASSANAMGISIDSTGPVNVTNTGLLAVDAITANGGVATANGIQIVNAGGFDTVVTNDGDIIVRESEDGGATFRRGMAINLAGSLNANVVNLISGNIYGNIDVNAGDEINVATGTTYFDGIINPEFVPVGGVTELTLDSGLFGEGDLNIDAGGNLILADPRLTGDPTMYDGPAYAFVENFNMGPDGTITYELQPAAGGVQPVGTYPQIFTNVANLDGTLVADITPAGGIFDDSYFWDNVIDANTRNGTFDACVIGGPFGVSPLLDLDCIYDGNNNVDLGLTRIAFNAVPGLTFNQGSAAFGLECLFDDVGAAGLIGTPIGGVIADLFLADAVQFPAALDQLAGAGYAGYLQSFSSLGYHYNAILDRATDCEVPALAGSVLECRVAPMHLWGQVDYQWRKKDGDIELSNYHADRWSALLGFDVNVGPTAVVGVSIGKVWNDVDFRNVTNASVKGDGWQLGLYGTYDPGAFYIKAMTSYSNYDGDARRLIDFTPFGGLTEGTILGDPDVRLWTFGLHGGYRIPMGATSVITPFLNYDYTSAKLKDFTEGGGTGAELTVNGGSEKHSWLTAGVKWAGQFGGVVPEVELGYRHMFGDRRASFNANFVGFDDCDFDIISATEKRGAITAGLSVGGKLFGNVDLRIGYEGAYNSDMTEHSGFLKLVLPLGAVAAPPPPPVIAPPPPPPPATQTCPDGTVILATEMCPAPPPPPPPPPPAPERG